MATPITRAVTTQLPDGELPREFLIFRRGPNESTSGPAPFDAQAAASIMAHAADRKGVRYLLDLEHKSLDPAATSLTRDATDACAWFDIEVRNGDLFAVRVEWTAEGAARLRAKSQRYISPAFYKDADGRPIELVNCGLVAMPAQHGMPALASRRSKVQVSEATKTAAAALLSDIKAGVFGELTARNSTVLAVRVPKTTARHIARTAASAGVTSGALVRGIVTRALTPEERDYCQRHGLTRGAFEARKARAVRTTKRK